MAGLMLSAGSLSDRYGRRGFLSAGLALFAITSAVAAQVDTADALIWGRAAMGVGAAVIFPATLALITNIFTDPVPRAKAIGLWAAMVGVGVAAGPITGGWLLENFWWGSIFLVNVPIAAVAIVGGLLFVPTSRDPAAPPVDVPGLVLSAIGVTALVYTIIEAPNVGWTNWHEPSRGSLWPPSFSPRSRCGSCARLIRCSTCRCSRTAGSPAAAWR